MIFYHGSKRIISSPIVGGSNPFNDYGASFYLTKDLESAKLWACKNNEVGIVNKYKINNKDFDNLKILDLTDKSKTSVLNWIAILMHFRKIDVDVSHFYKENLDWLEQNYYIDVSQYDVVIGFRADDAYFRFPIAFVENRLSLENLEKVYVLGELGIQYAFVSEKSTKKLKFYESIQCESEFLGKYYKIVKEATRKFNEVLSEPFSSKQTYLSELVKNGNQ